MAAVQVKIGRRGDDGHGSGSIDSTHTSPRVRWSIMARADGPRAT